MEPAYETYSEGKTQDHTYATVATLSIDSGSKKQKTGITRHNSALQKYAFVIGVIFFIVTVVLTGLLAHTMLTVNTMRSTQTTISPLNNTSSHLRERLEELLIRQSEQLSQLQLLMSNQSAEISQVKLLTANQAIDIFHIQNHTFNQSELLSQVQHLISNQSAEISMVKLLTANQSIDIFQIQNQTHNQSAQILQIQQRASDQSDDIRDVQNQIANPAPKTLCSNNLLMPNGTGSLESLDGFYANSAEITNSKVFRGSYSVKVDCSRPGFIKKTIHFEPSDDVKSLKAGLWAYAENVTELPSIRHFSLYTILYTASGSQTSKYSTFNESASGWQRVFGEVTIADTISKVDLIGFCQGGQSGFAYFDEMALYKNPATVCD